MSKEDKDMVTGTKVKVEFKFRNATPGTYRFQEVAEEGKEKIGSLYIKKSAFEGAPQPEGVVVTIEVK